MGLDKTAAFGEKRLIDPPLYGGGGVGGLLKGGAAAGMIGMAIRRYAPFTLRRGNWIQTGPARKSMGAASKHFDEWKVPGMKNRVKEIRPDDPGGGWQRNRREIMESIEKGMKGILK